VLEQQVEGHRDEDPNRRLEQVGDDAETHKSGVGNYVPGRFRRVARDVDLGVHKALGKATEDGDEQVEDAGDSREALR